MDPNLKVWIDLNQENPKVQVNVNQLQQVSSRGQQSHQDQDLWNFKDQVKKLWVIRVHWWAYDYQYSHDRWQDTNTEGVQEWFCGRRNKDKQVAQSNPRQFHLIHRQRCQIASHPGHRLLKLQQRKRDKLTSYSKREQFLHRSHPKNHWSFAVLWLF